MKIRNLFLILTGLYTVSFTVQAEHVDDPSLVAKGAKLYSQNCGRCHNPRPATDYTKKEWSVVMPHMREKAHMTGKEALAVEAFLASTLTADVRNEFKASLQDAPQKTGEQLVAQFGCQGCHQMSGSGGELGPSLDGIVDSKGKDFILKKLKNPKFNNTASAMPRFPMTENDMMTLVDFLSKN